MIPSRIMCFAHTHRIVREVDIAVIAYNMKIESAKDSLGKGLKQAEYNLGFELESQATVTLDS